MACPDLRRRVSVHRQRARAFASDRCDGCRRWAGREPRRCKGVPRDDVCTPRCSSSHWPTTTPRSRRQVRPPTTGASSSCRPCSRLPQPRSLWFPACSPAGAVVDLAIPYTSAANPAAAVGRTRPSRWTPFCAVARLKHAYAPMPIRSTVAHAVRWARRSPSARGLRMSVGPVSAVALDDRLGRGAPDRRALRDEKRPGSGHRRSRSDRQCTCGRVLGGLDRVHLLGGPQVLGRRARSQAVDRHRPRHGGDGHRRSAVGLLRGGSARRGSLPRGSGPVLPGCATRSSLQGS